MSEHVDCSCPVCMAHRLHPDSPEHTQEIQIRLDHASKARARRGGRVALWILIAAVLLVVSLYVIRS